MARPIVVVSCIIEMSNRLLMGMRLDKGEEGEWCFPGGKVESKETMVEAATRELMEETNLLVRAEKWKFMGFSEPSGKIIMFFHTKDFTGQTRCLDKNFASWEWVPKNSWPNPLVPGAELFREIWYGICKKVDGRREAILPPRL